MGIPLHDLRTNKFMQRSSPNSCTQFVHWVLRYRWLLLISFSTSMLVGIFFASRLRFEESLDYWFLQDSDEAAAYESFREKFGSDEFVVVALYPKDVFATNFLIRLDKFTHEAEKLPLVKQTLSLTNAKVLQRRGNRLELVDFVPRNSAGKLQEAIDVRKLQLRIEQAPHMLSRLLDKSGSATAVIVELSPSAGNLESETLVVDQLRKLSEAIFGNLVKSRFAGNPVLDNAIFRYSRRDLMLLAPLAFGACAIFCLLLFRDLRIALIATLAPAVATIAVLGLMGGLEQPISFLTSALLMIVLVAGIADSIHLLTTYNLRRSAGNDCIRSLQHTLSECAVPCMLTTLTTAVGFISLLACDIEPVRQFGVMAAFGVSVALLASLVLVPSLLVICDTQNRIRCKRLPVERLLNLLTRLSGMNRRQRGILLAFALMIAGPCLVAIPNLHVNASPLSLFSADQRVRRDAERIDEDFGGFATLEFQFTAQESVVHWSNLKKIDQFASWLVENSLATDTLSFVDLLDEANKQIPFRRDKLGRPQGVWTLLREAEFQEPAMIARLLKNDFSVARLSARMPLSDSRLQAANIAAINDHLEVNFKDSQLSVSWTGYVKLFSELRSTLVSGQIESFAIAAVAITVVLGVALRSAVLAMLSIALNFIPIVCGFGVMSLADIPIDPGTIMIASVAMGIVVDDTCHLLWGVRRRMRQGHLLTEALKLSVKATGPAICITSLVLAVGFSTLLLGSFAPSNYFGFVMLWILLAALLVDLLIVPAVLLSVKLRLVHWANKRRRDHASHSIPHRPIFNSATANR